MKHYLLFETVFGTCGMLWQDHGVVRTPLPEPSQERLLAALLADAEGVAAHQPPSWISSAVGAIQRHLEGAGQDLSEVPVDLHDGSPFALKVYGELRRVRSGCTVTYGDLAAAVGAPGAARAVGRVLGKNPVPLIIPCHRVLASGGKLRGFSASGGIATQARLLEIEGVTVPAVSGRGAAPGRFRPDRMGPGDLTL